MIYVLKVIIEMTAEEKLEKAIEFIKRIENMQLPIETVEDIIDSADIYCSECGFKTEVEVGNNFNRRYVEAKHLEDLKDEAWHILADIVE